MLQQIESFADGTVSANDCFRLVSRYFDCIARPEQVIPALQRAMAVLTDPAECGPVTLALRQDTQAEAYDYPASFFDERVFTPRRIRPDEGELEAAAALLRDAKKPLIVAGGGVLYAEAESTLAGFAESHGIPVAETQAGKSSLVHDHPRNSARSASPARSAANALAEEADVVLAVGTRLQDFTTGLGPVQESRRRIVALNVQGFDAVKHGAQSLNADAHVGLEARPRPPRRRAPGEWTQRAGDETMRWLEVAARHTGATNAALPSDAQVIGAVHRRAGRHRRLRGRRPARRTAQALAGGRTGGYHLEYGYSCMGYEIAGGLAKMAHPDREVVVMVGDGSYLMMNSEIASAVMLGLKLTIVVLDNRGYGYSTGCAVADGGEISQISSSTRGT